MEGTLDRECARLSRGPRGTGLGGLRATAWEPRNGGPRLRERRRRQGCQRRTDSTRARGKKTPSRTIDRAPKWETRREARFSPVSLASGGPEPPGACSARLRTGEAAREEDVRADEHGAARLRNESDPRASAERHRTGKRSLRWEEAEHECSSWNGFGVQKSIGRIAGRDARGRYQAHQGHARPSTKESPSRDMAAGTKSNEDGARASFSSSNHGDADWFRLRAQASSGSHPEGCGLEDSGSPRAASARLPIRWKGVRVVDASP
jgi:hypothetical protein